MNKPKLKNKNERGITLVALVVTIIVLLILAGVAINMAINSDGLFGKANEAVTKWNSAVAEEDRIMQNILEQMNEINGGTTVGGNTGDGDDDGPPTLPEGWDSTKVSAVVEEGTRTAPIPVGYVASQIPTEDTISEGLVIYQGTDSVTGEANSTAHTTAMTTRNQFVWIPVDDIDYMVMCKSNASGSVCDLELIDGVLQCTNSAHSSTATDLCGRVYATTSSNTTVDGNKISTYSQTFDEAQWGAQTWSTSSYREPDIVVGIGGTSYDGGDSNLTEIGLSATDDLTVQQVFLAQLTNDFTVMATSVAKYGGFYVSRYEAGENGASLKNQKVLVAGTSTTTGYNPNAFVNGNKWYGMYNTLRTSTAIDKTAVSSHMIWGSQFDMIIKFLGENSNNEPQVGHTARQLASQKLTGETTTDIMSNIYDLEGNNYEWTAQANSTVSRASRGGYFNDVASFSIFSPASRRSGSLPTNASCSSGSRSALYL